ncbi:TPA: DUF4222 domain-containing protein [Salmonella enterica]|jgi:hypothetical protein|uniref:DUF4222 domain-containing protein n=1 Tax=Salmonella enterica I TaxID=59201 RepID=A0A612HB60_SALET|nr:DUF4222 domain-containing protein [Salmonella enterica subsp. enterica]EDT1338904.1 DUF4222 domain-containing protein [Salmonella enterica subsp. enterica serovar Enteritidis]EHJ3658802.1 DUF4222 domain-containing protein [Salmonella enterica]HAU7316519.1 DUF4222 domain-containing protein [Salmonella enterica subsp. enterica serovar Wangata]HDN4850028.1 DUF4222 domain-containing protein [Salmonella enterica subsp. enterica serovar Bovismorbificans]HDO5800042.1 DUF4222 domain-containing prot
MFSLIQRGQLYVDDNGWPVTIYCCNVYRVVCRREDGRLHSVSIREFSHRFERLEHQEYRQIKAEIEQERHLKTLRELRVKCI